MRKIFAVNEVIRYTVCIFIITKVSVIYSQFDVTPFESNVDNQIKDPYDSTVDYLDHDLDSNYHDLQSIYEDTQNLLYNDTGTQTNVQQVYPSIQQQNFSDWFAQLLKNPGSGNSTQYLNNSKLPPESDLSKDSFYKLPNNFKVFPGTENVTVMNTTLPPNPHLADANNIFKDAAGSINNTDVVYTTVPRIDSLSLNKMDNNSDILNKFFQGFKNIKNLINPITSIPNELRNKPTPTNSNTAAPLTIDMLAKKIAEDANKNSSKYLKNMMTNLGLENVNSTGTEKPLNLYRLNSNGEHREFNPSPVKRNPPPMPPQRFPHSSQGNPTGNTLLNETNTANDATFVPNLPATTAQPSSTTSSESDQTNVTSSTTTNSTANFSPSITNSSTPRTNASFSAMATDSFSDQYGKIVYSFVFFIHGSHTPSLLDPSDPYSNAKYWPEGINRLTNVGKTEMYQLGKWFRQRYRELIGYHYNASLVTIESGGNDITLTSAEVVATGLFPPSGYEVWNQAIRWQPIPIHSVPAENDYTILMSKPCRQYNLQTKDLSGSPEWQQFYENNTEIFNLLSENSGMNFTKDDILDDLEKIFYLNENLKIEEKRGLPLPNWTQNVYPDQLTTLAEKYIEFAVATRQLQKIKTGPFFQKLTDHMSKKINNANSTSPFLETLHFYSGDTLGVGFIMKTLGINTSLIPSDASALIFDLRYKDDEYIITVSYKNSSTNYPTLLTIPNCQPICQFNNFTEITKDLMPNDWDDECATITLSDLTYTIPILIFGVIIIFILALVVVLLIIKCCKYIKGSKATFS